MNIKRTLYILKRFLQANLFAIVLFFSIAIITINGISETSKTSAAEEIRLAKESITRAVISCYALEGMYPESYEYIKENYGVRINEEKYFVSYDIFASNIMPDITIIERQVVK